MRSGFRHFALGALLLATFGTSIAAEEVSTNCADVLADLPRLGSPPAQGPAPQDSERSAVRMGPLIVSKRNPRYFADPAGHVVLLVGSHTWNNLIDMDVAIPTTSL